MKINPQASESRRGRHPDLDDNGELLPDTLTTPDARERDRNRRMADPVEHDSFMTRLTSWQSSLPEYVQKFVQGREYSDIQAYQRSVDLAMDIERATLNASVLLTDAQIADMSLDEFNHYFDEHGQPRPGVKVHYQRGQILDDTRP